jgi:hypothetical protein
MLVSNKFRGGLKVLYYIIFILAMIGHVYLGYQDTTAIILLIYLIFGTLLSISLKLSLLNRNNLFDVSKDSYNKWDTVINSMFFLMSIGIIIYYFFTS